MRDADAPRGVVRLDPGTWVPVLFFVYQAARALRNFVTLEVVSGDPAIFVQMFYHTLAGRPLFSTFEQGNHLGVHFSPILLVFVPLMRLFQAFPVLMLAQSAALATAFAWFYRWMRDRDGAAAAGVMLLMLCLHPTLSWDGHKDFHPLSLMSLPFVGMTLAYHRGRLWAFVGWAAVLVLVRESLFTVPLAWAVICLLTKYPRRWAAAGLGMALLHVLIGSVWAPWFFSGGIRPGLMDYFAQYGTTPGAVLHTWWTEPARVWAHVWTLEKGRYLYKLLLPLGLLPPLTRAWVLPAVPVVVLVLLSSDGRLADPIGHYSVAPVWWAVLATASFLHGMRSRLDGPRVAGAVRLLLGLFCLYLAVGACLAGREALTASRGERYAALLRVRAELGPETAVVAPRYLAGHLAWREELWFAYETFRGDGPAETVGAFLVLEAGEEAASPPGWRPWRREGPFVVYARGGRETEGGER